MTSVGLEQRCLHVTDGQTIHHSVARGCAAGVPHPATGAQLGPASAMSESVNRCKYRKSETVTPLNFLLQHCTNTKSNEL